MRGAGWLLLVAGSHCFRKRDDGERRGREDHGARGATARAAAGRGAVRFIAPRRRARAASTRLSLMAALAAAAAVSLIAAATVTGTPAGGGAPQAVAAADAQAGRSVFASQCASCHGPNGEGGVGPSLAAAGFADLVAPKVRAGGGGHARPSRARSASPTSTTSPPSWHRTSPTPRRGRRQCPAGASRLSPVLLRLPRRHGSRRRARGGPQRAVVQGEACGQRSGRRGIRGPRNMPVFTGTLDVRQQAAVALYIQATLVDARPRRAASASASSAPSSRASSPGWRWSC